MSDSGITNAPPAPRETGLPQDADRSGRLIARIERATSRLQEVFESRRVQGEVIRENPDGSVRVRTSEGDLDIRLQRSELKTGQKIEIDLPPGSPPAQAAIRLLPPDTPQPHAPVTMEAPVTVELGGGRRFEDMPLPSAGQLPVSKILTEFQPGQSFRILPVLFSEGGISYQEMLSDQINSLMQPVKSAHIFSYDNELPRLISSINIDPGAIASPDKIGIIASGTGEHQILQNFPSIKNVLLYSAGIAAAFPAWIGEGAKTPGDIFYSLKPSPFSPVHRPLAMNVQILQVKPPDVKLAPPGSFQETHFSAEGTGTKQNLLLSGAAPGSMKAGIIGETAEKLPVISVIWPQSGLLQNFILQAPAENIPPGTELQLLPYPEPASRPADMIPPLAPFLLSEAMRPGPWQIMEDLARTLSRQTPQIAQAFTATLPAPANPAQMGAAAMFFLAAVRSGDLASWLGDRAVDALRKEGRGSPLLSRLGSEISGSGRIQSEPVSQDWRGFPLPLSWQNEIHKAAFYYRRADGENDKDEKDGREKPTRFIFDLTLSRMGDVQIDGLLNGKRLDIALRTQRRLGPAMQQEMRRIYAGAMAETGYNGEIIFQDDPARWVKVIREDKMLRFSS